MKIRSIYSISFFFVSLLSLISCSSALDVSPDGRISYADIFSDNDKVAAYLNTCYGNMPDKGQLYDFYERGPVAVSDEAWETDAEAEPGKIAGKMYNGNAAADLGVGGHPLIDISTNQGNNSDYWDHNWHSIRDCNIFLKYIGTAKVTNESDRARWTGEAHLLRAFYYSEILRWFGMSLPIETTPFNLTDDFSKVKRSSYYDVVKFIMADCDSALAVDNVYLPWRINSSNDGGRLNKALAEALKSRMILYAASPLYNNGQDYWKEAYDVNKKALADLRAHGFQLYNNVQNQTTYLSADAWLYPDDPLKKSITTIPVKYAALYNEYFCTSMAYGDDPIDKETIFQAKNGQQNVVTTDGVNGGYKAGTCPSQELVDAFETTDGQPILNLSNPYLDEKHTQPNYNPNNTLYDPNNPYANRDPRFYADIYFNGSKRKAAWNFAELPNCYENYNPSDKLTTAASYRTRVIATWNGEPRTGISPSIRKVTRTGYYERKFLHPNGGNLKGYLIVNGANFKFARLGEVILNCAEAAVESNNLTEARDLINEIRERVGMPDLPTGLSQNDLRLRLRNERRVELAMEEDRYFDIRRWSSPNGDLSATDKWVGAMDITRNANGTYSYTRRPVRLTERKCYTNKYLKIPISLNEANRMRTLTGENWQNPGW